MTKWLVHAGLCPIGIWSQFTAQCRTSNRAANTCAGQCSSPLPRGPELVLTKRKPAKRGLLTRCNFTIALRFAAWHVSRLSVSLCRAESERVRDRTFKGCCTRHGQFKHHRLGCMQSMQQRERQSCSWPAEQDWWHRHSPACSHAGESAAGPASWLHNHMSSSWALSVGDGCCSLLNSIAAYQMHTTFRQWSRC